MKKLLYLSFFPVLTVLGFYLSVQVVYARIYKDPDPGTWKVQPVEDPAKSKSSTESITPFSTEEHLVPVKEKLLLTEENERGELITVSAGYKAIEPSVRTKSGNLVLRTDPGKILKVVLDPGHGGRDDASQVAGIYEKDLTLEFAKVIRKVLQERGFEVVLTRESDEFVPLIDRAKVQGDIFISLHANNIPSGRSDRNGMEIFIGSTMDQGSHLLDQSTRLAKVFHHELREIGDIKMKEAIVSQSLAVLRTNTSPAILLELGYMSHPGDLKLMTDESYQRRIADAFAKVLTSYN